MKKTLSLLFCLGLLLSIFLQIGMGYYLYAQTFNLPTEVCPGENITFTNPQPTAPQHRWDFCTGDLLQTPKAALIVNPIVGIARPEGIDIVNDGANWYGFITARNSNNLVRLNFGNSLDNTPTLDILSVSSLNGPIGVKVLKENNIWYLFVVNVNNNSISKFIMGSSLLNTPLFQGLITVSGLAFPCRIDFITDKNTNLKYAYVTNYGTTVSVLDFGNSINNPPTAQSTANLGISGLIGLKSFQHGSNYYSVVSGDGGLLRIITWGSTPFNNSPLITTVANLGTPIDLHADVDGGSFIIYSASLNGNIIRYSFNNFPNLPADITNIGNFGLLGQQNMSNRPTLAFTMAQQGSEWYAFAINRHLNLNPPFNQHQLARLKFPNACNANIATSQAVNPTMNYVLPGNYAINLRTVDADGNLDKIYTDNIVVKQATVGNFSVTNQCIGETTIFNNLSIGSDANVIAWEWDFGDNSPKSYLRSPTHAYSIAGTYTASLKVTNITGCVNTISKAIVISERPKVNFSISSGTCLGTPVQFTDQSTWQSQAPVLTYLWDFGDGVGVLRGNASDISARNPTYTYNTPGIYNVTLSLFEGNPTNCASSITKQIVVVPQPVADFNFSNLCVNAPTQFTDASSLVGNWGDAITQWEWNFSGRGTSSAQNPRFIFTNTGTCNVSLKVTTKYGCSHTINRSVTILPSIISSFNNSIVEGNAPLTINFRNTTQGASTYLWNFGDGNSSTQESPTYTFTKQGTYQVEFQARGANGCGSLATQSIKVFAPLLDIALQNFQIDAQGKMRVSIQNKSSFPLNEINFVINIGKNVNLIETWRGFVAPNQQIEHIFNQSLSPEQLDNNPFICVTASTVNQLNDTQIDDNTACFKILKNFEIFSFSPTPATNLITINYYVPQDNKPVKLVVYNAVGAKVREYTLPTQNQGTTLYYFDTNNLGNGVYYFHFDYEGNRQIRKAMIMR